MLLGGMDMGGMRRLDIGCGAGGPGLKLVEEHGVELDGIEIETSLIEDAKRRAKERHLEENSVFQIVVPGPLSFPDESFDIDLTDDSDW